MLKQESYIWKLGKNNSRTESVDVDFKDIKTEEHIYRVPGDWQSIMAFDIPRVLAGNADSGCVKLKLEFNLEKGVYCFVRRLLEPEVPICCEVYFDGYELDVYHTGAAYSEDGKLLCRIQEAPYPFICTASGRHTITLSMDRSMNEGRHVRIESLALIPYKIQPHLHSLNTEIPGRVCLDAWGRSAERSFHRRGKGSKVPLPVPAHVYDTMKFDTIENIEYFQRRVVDESYKRGANFTQFYPYVENWIGPEWEEDKVIELLEYAHKRDMIIEDHGNFIRKIKEAQDKIAAELKCLRGKAGYCFDLLTKGWSKILDGFESEGHKAVDHPESMVKMYNILWEYNPGCYMNECGSRWGTWRWLPSPKNSPWQRVKGPNFIQTIMNAHEIVGFQRFRRAVNGYDDKTPISPFLKHSELTNEYGKKFLGYQADSRQQFIGHPCGGGSNPDWIIKQCNDFFRPRYKNPEDPYESCIWWLGESEYVCPDWVKDYVYAISQDPIKCAVTTDLKTQGRGGVFDIEMIGDIKRRAIAANIDVDLSPRSLWELRKRSNFLWDTQLIQNNYLRLYLDPRKQKEVLVYDMERTAHYDSNSLCIALTNNFLITRDAKGKDECGKRLEVEEPGGYLSILRSEIAMNVDGKRLDELRTYTMINDTPYLRLNIKRSVEETLPIINSVLGCEGYDVLLVEGKEHRQEIEFVKTSGCKIMRLRDSSGIKPDLIVAILDWGMIKRILWEPANSLTLESADVNKEEIKLAVAVPTDLYNESEIGELAKSFMDKREALALKGRTVSITNRYNIPLVKVVKITDPTGGPYLVKEYGWWIFRGAQSSLFHKEHDYVKVYLSPSGKARIQPYGFIKGVVKPGWGCQYILAIKDVAGKEEKIECTVKVMSVTPYIFAPRLEFKNKIEKVRLNGKSWHYFDGYFVFLPNKPGVYKIEVNIRAGEKSPHLVRTGALIESTNWQKDIFSFDARFSVWVKKIPGELSFTAIVDIGMRKLRALEGAELIRKSSQRVMIKFKPGKVKVFTEESINRRRCHS